MQLATADRTLFILIASAAVCAVAVVYPYILYPAILLLQPRRSVERGRPDAAGGAQFTLLFCAYNEAASMPSKLANIKELKGRYPHLSVLAFDDGSDDGTADMIEREAPYVRLVRGAGRNGKAHGMKLLAATAESEFLVFTDANVLLDVAAFDALAGCYADATVGGVCGALRYLGAEGSSTASVGSLYWRLEERIKDLESATGSVMGADGSIFSIRRNLYPDFPDTVLDDFTVSLECVFRGYRLVKSNDVIAYERLVSARADEFSRKIRIAARAFGTHRYLRKKRCGMSGYNRFKYASHKTIRWFGGAFLIVGAAAGFAAAAIVSPLFAAALFVTIALLLALGLYPNKGILSSCTEVIIAMVATLIGVGHALRGHFAATWNPAKSRELGNILRKVALHGSYFGYNFGDTVLCALFCRWIRSYSHGGVVLPLATRRNMELIGADARGLIPFLSCSDLVFCGGGYFGDSGRNSTRWSIRNYFRHFLIAELAMLLRKRVYILGTGVGPISSAFLRSELKRLVGYAECVIVRDDESRDFLEGLGVTRKVGVDVDAAMYLERDFFASATGGLSTSVSTASAQEGTPVVAVHLTNFDAPYWDAMAKVVAEFCLREPGIRPLLITDSITRSGRPAAQDKASQRLKQLIPEATQFGYGGDPLELCRLLDTVDLVITNKLHVGIVSVVLGKQVISLPQHAKTPRFYRQIGMSSVCVVDNQPERLHELLELWRSGEFPRVAISARRNIYQDTLKLHLGAGG